MLRQPSTLHHDIKTAPQVQPRVFIPVRRVVDFTPGAVRQFQPASSTAKFRRSFTRLIGSLCIVAALFSVAPWGQTISFYNDIERSTGSTLTAGLVDFVLIDTPFTSLTSSANWEVEVEPHQFSNPFYYYASSTDLTGDTELCEALTVTATLDGQFMYQGSLSELITATTTLIDTWVFDFANFEQFAGQSCMFAIEYNGWQTRHGMDQGGYSDTELVKYMITVPSLLLSKVYLTQECESDTDIVNATSSDQCVSTQTWIEIYNRTAVTINTQNWSLCDGDSCFVLSESIDVPAGEFAIVAADPEIHTEISLPLGVAPIVTNGVWFMADLAPAGDMLQLRDPAGLVIDQLNWGISTTSWNNYDPSLWADNSLIATSGYALARIPFGFDSNQPNDWVMLGVPTLVIDSYETPIEPGATTTITYTAINTNGLNEDLRIDVYLFDRDLQLYVIELDVDNSGSYSFVVPSGIEGPVRIKFVATSPENILLNARFLTDEIPLVNSASVRSSGGRSQELTSLQIISPATTTASTTDLEIVIEIATTTDSQASSTATTTIDLPETATSSSDVDVLGLTFEVNSEDVLVEDLDIEVVIDEPETELVEEITILEEEEEEEIEEIIVIEEDAEV